MKKLAVIVDMQRDFLTGTLANEYANSIVPRLCGKIKELADDGYEIVFTMDTHNKDYLSTQEGLDLPVEHCIEGTEGWYLDERVEQVLTEVLLGKGYNGQDTIYDLPSCFCKDTFGSQDLGDFVQKGDFDTVVFLGVCTDICVLSNVLLVRAFAPNIKINVYKDYCAGVTSDSHNIALQAMKNSMINIL